MIFERPPAHNHHHLCQCWTSYGSAFGTQRTGRGDQIVWVPSLAQGGDPFAPHKKNMQPLNAFAPTSGTSMLSNHFAHTVTEHPSLVEVQIPPQHLALPWQRTPVRLPRSRQHVLSSENPGKHSCPQRIDPATQSILQPVPSGAQSPLSQHTVEGPHMLPWPDGPRQHWLRSSPARHAPPHQKEPGEHP